MRALVRLPPRVQVAVLNAMCAKPQMDAWVSASHTFTEALEAVVEQQAAARQQQQQAEAEAAAANESSGSPDDDEDDAGPAQSRPRARSTPTTREMPARTTRAAEREHDDPAQQGDE